MAFYKDLHLTTIRQALESKNPTIGSLQRMVKNGETLIRAILVEVLTDLVLFLNVGKSFNEQQVVQTVELITEDFKHFKLDDFKLCFNNAKKGYYGKIYDRLDGQIIFEWLTTYANDRSNESEKLNFNNHQINKNEKFQQNEINPEGQKKVIEILKDSIKNVQDIKKEKTPVEKSETEKQIQIFLKEFETIFLKEGFELTGQRFIKIEGKNLSQIEYVEFKLK